MASIDSLKASNGTGNASVATIQSVRAALATTIVVDTVQGINTNFHATMGTPHTFVDPVTSETITVISEATAVDFKGHVDGTNLEIDTIAPGYTDNGSSVNDIVIIKPTTQWADEVADVLEVSIEDNGDLKKQAILDALDLNSPNNGWNVGLPVPNTIVDNGNRSYTWTFTGTDVTDTLSPGMRLRSTRTVTAPTQCTDLEASSSQYWQDTSVSGMTFTDDFVAGAWVYLESYGTISSIASRYNGTSGWRFFIDTDGTVKLHGHNASSANYSRVSSYQSIPLNKWVHVTAQLDMSAFTATTTTSYVMLDGVDVPAVVFRSGTNPTALVQAGNLQIGAENTTNYFDGKIAQAFVSSAKITQANVRLIKDQGLTSALITTHSIVSAYDFNGNANDLNTTSANNLSAVASAGYVTDSPFSLGNELASAYTDGTTDFGIVTSATFSTDSTVTVQAPEGCTFPTSGGLSAVYYSSLDTPYGFPGDKGRWAIETLLRANLNIGSVANTWYSGATTSAGSFALNVPIGKWIGYTKFQTYSDSGANVIAEHYTTLTKTPGTQDDVEWSTHHTAGTITSGAGGPFYESLHTSRGYITTASATSYYAMIKNAGTTTNQRFEAVTGVNKITIEPAYV